ncbi:MAG: zeta toxin family protein [Kofleriaceae bacterium]
MKPLLLLIAGPNGAGKSTFYEYFLSDPSLPFLNADLLAAESGLDSFEAARILDAKRARLIESKQGFVTETVFSDTRGAKLDMLRAAVEAGFDVKLIYIGLESAEISARRVAQRVAHGGHDVPPEKIAARYQRTLDNLRAALPVVPDITIFDNSSATEPYRLLARFQNGVLVERAEGHMPAWTRGIIPPARAATKGPPSAPTSRAPTPRKKR